MFLVGNTENTTHILSQISESSKVLLLDFHMSLEAVMKAHLPPPERGHLFVSTGVKQSYFSKVSMEEN